MISQHRLESKWRIRYFKDVDVWVVFPPLSEGPKAMSAGFLTWQEAAEYLERKEKADDTAFTQ